MVDPKVVELKIFNSLPHMLIPVVTEPKKVPAALKWLLGEMEQRYQLFAKVNVRNIVGFNTRKKAGKPDLPPPPDPQATLTGVDPLLDDGLAAIQWIESRHRLALGQLPLVDAVPLSPIQVLPPTLADGRAVDDEMARLAAHLTHVAGRWRAGDAARGLDLPEASRVRGIHQWRERGNPRDAGHWGLSG
jgi:hypothetical protein